MTNDSENLIFTNPETRVKEYRRAGIQDDRRCVLCGHALELIYEDDKPGLTFWLWVCPNCGAEHGEGLL
jgi:predicted RNA-binding Zn-ribbon protein involved in translation (DUF1610 family)